LQFVLVPTPISDADTLKIWNQSIRLLGIDAPEYAQTCKNANGREYKCGLEALNRLKEIIGSKEICCGGDCQSAFSSSSVSQKLNTTITFNTVLKFTVTGFQKSIPVHKASKFE